MAATDSGQDLLARMAELTQTDARDWFLVTKARQGMQVALAAAKAATGRTEVVTQLFTCVTAIDPILAAGLAPRYADVSPDTLSVCPSQVAAGSDTCAVVLQHSFGLVDGASSAELARLAHQVGAILLEDSAHCVGRMVTDGQGRPLADVSVHSFGVEKILPGTYFGGAVWVNPQMANAEVAQAVRAALGALPPADARLQKAAKSYRNQMRVLTRLPQGAAARLRASWERKGTYEPAVSKEERLGATNHDPSKPSDWMCSQALAALQGLAANEAGRRACVDAYLAALTPVDVHALRVPKAALAAAGQPLLRFPVFAATEAEATATAAAIAQLGYYVPAWPRPLLVPGVLDPAAYGLAQGTDAWPVSQGLSAGVVALPTDIDAAQVPAVVQAVRDACASSYAYQNQDR